MTSFEALEEAYRHARKQKRYRREVLEFSSNLDENLHKIQDELRNGTFKFGPYRKHWIYVPKKRLVMALPFESRIVQWAIYLVLNPFYEKLMIEDSYACREGKGTLAAAQRLQYWLDEVSRKPGEWFIVKSDISKYFYRVDHVTLLSILGRRVKDERLMALLETIIDASDERFGLPAGMSAEECLEEEWLASVGMPIGNLTSQLFANIYLNELDQYVKHTLRIHRYVRTMDDTVAVIEGKAQALEYRDAIRAFLKEELRLDLNGKTQIIPVKGGRVEYVGYIISAGKKGFKMRKATVRRIKSAWKGICAKYAAGRISRGELERRRQSYKGLIGYCDAAKLKARLNGIYTYAREAVGYG